ncbi:hypothetical protein ABZ465_09900 [Streptomyces griseoincarnatus]
MPTRTPEPTAVTTRALAPDLARGFMLLFIALGNSHYFLAGGPVLGGYPQEGSPLDSAVTWLIATFVDGRAFPMFGLLFGYGVAHMVRRQADDAPARYGGCCGGAAWPWSSSARCTACCSTPATSWPRTASCCSWVRGPSAGRTAGCWRRPRSSSCSAPCPATTR